MPKESRIAIEITILFTIMMISTLFSSTASAQESISVSTDKSSYNYGDTITISGFVNPVVSNQLLMIDVIDPSGNERFAACPTNPSNNGIFSCSLVTSGYISVAGTYTVVASYGGTRGQFTFSYSGSPSQTTIPQSTSSLSQNPQSTQLNIIPQWIRNTADWWASGQIGDSDFIKGIQYLIDNNILQTSNQDELSKLKDEVQNLQTQLQQDQEQIQQLQSQSSQSQQNVNSLEEQLKQAQTNINTQQSQPMTVISSGSVHWYFSDSKGNRYNWYIPVHTYDVDVMANALAAGLVPTYNLELSNGGTVSTYDYSGFAKILSERKEFSTVVDTLYDNAGSDDQFIYEVWHMVAELTTYSKDITNTNLLPYEVLTRGEGDCKDKAILIADLLRSSSHTSNWDIHLKIMDSNNPTNPQTVNHMIVAVNTGHSQYLIEPTTTPDVNGLTYWSGTVIGWNVPF